ncbi:MAG: FHA domain-containing protein [Verrucomicrobiota bacterium]
MAFLILESPNGDRNYFTLREERTLLGRDEGNHIVIDSEYVSAFHAEFRLLPDGEMELMDRDSHNGTEVNGEKIKPSVTLDNGDRLQFGLAEGCFYKAIEQSDPSAGDGEDGLDRAFFPNSSDDGSEPTRIPGSSRGSMEELSGVVLSFEEFDYATNESPERVAHSLIKTARIVLPEEQSAN